MNIVITGAGGVLCSAFARALAADGHKVALLDLNLDAAEKVAAAVEGKNIVKVIVIRGKIINIVVK